MEPVRDRIRKVLSDAGGFVRRAAEVPARDPQAPAEGPLQRLLLRRRLDALRVAEATPALRPSPPPARWVEELDDDGRTLEQRVGGADRTTEHGTFLYVERRRPLDEVHGRLRLADLAATPLPLRRTERRPGDPAELDPREVVYLDVETTGLAGGTGTIAFLIGTARIEDDALVVRQYFVRDFPEEAAALCAFASDLGSAPLVTFNGRSFDWPLLTTRLRLHRQAVPDRAHVDLLPPARRLWAGSLESHSLGDLEHAVLGVAREDDLPGWMIPEAYFAYLRTSRSHRIAHAFRHNEVDIVSMAVLGAEVGRIVRDPASRRDAHALDHLGTARLLLDLGEPARARTCLESALSGDLPHPSPSLRRLLGACHRRAGDLDAAMRAWTEWLEREPHFDPHPFEELAKACEHRRKDLAQALAYVESALDRCPAHDPRRTALEHRATRLRRRLARRTGPPPAAP